MPTDRYVTPADPAWFDCGDRASPDYGRLFLQPAARGGSACWFDRAQTRFAMACAAGAAPRLGQTVRLHGRAFPVADWTDPAKRDAVRPRAWSAHDGETP